MISSSAGAVGGAETAQAGEEIAVAGERLPDAGEVVEAGEDGGLDRC